MIRFVNCGAEEFKKRIKNKEVIIYGAGRALETVVNRFFLEGSYALLVDSDSKKTGKAISISDVKLMVSSQSELIEFVKHNNKAHIMILISTPNYAADIIDCLDVMPELEGINCYVHSVIRNTKELYEPVFFSHGEQRIPKTIHYIWLGGRSIPEEFEKYIETWQNKNPDFRILRWDESNYDLEKNDYVKEAYRAGALSHVTNYMRLDIIYSNGGIYLDTDVEVIKNLECLLYDESFFCMASTDSINNGCGFGAVRGNSLIKDMMSEYEGKHFDLDKGGVGLRPNHCFLEDALISRGFEIIDRYQKHDGIVLYPKEVMSPLTIDGMPDFMTENTLSIHHENGSWKTAKEKEDAKRLTKLIKTRMINAERI